MAVITEKKYVCDKHGEVKWDHCEQCLAEKCEHGKMLSQQCDECSVDTSWATAPLTAEEIARIAKAVEQESLGIFRRSTKPRNYTCVSLLPKLIAEYMALRSKSI